MFFSSLRGVLWWNPVKGDRTRIFFSFYSYLEIGNSLPLSPIDTVKCRKDTRLSFFYVLSTTRLNRTQNLVVGRTQTDLPDRSVRPVVPTLVLPFRVWVLFSTHSPASFD